MRDLTTKVDGNTLNASEFVDSQSELKNFIQIAGGITLSAGDLLQFNKAFGNLAGSFNWMTVGGSTNAWTLIAMASRPTVETLLDGQVFRFRVPITNTSGTVTLNIQGTGVLGVVLPDGTATIGIGDIRSNRDSEVRYNSATAKWVLQDTGNPDAIKKTVFTSNGTFTPDTNAKSFKVIVTGGGGGGGGVQGVSSFTSGVSGSGGAGGTAIKYVSRPFDSSYTVVVGAGGTAGDTTPAVGGAGGNSTINGATLPIVTGLGSGGGSPQIASAANSIPGTPGLGATGGDVNITGGGSGNGIVLDITSSGEVAQTSSSSSSFWGGGPQNPALNATGITAVTFGTGGGGAAVSKSATGRSGGVGAPGIVVVEEYF